MKLNHELMSTHFKHPQAAPRSQQALHAVEKQRSLISLRESDQYFSSQNINARANPTEALKALCTKWPALIPTALN